MRSLLKPKLAGQAKPYSNESALVVGHNQGDPHNNTREHYRYSCLIWVFECREFDTLRAKTPYQQTTRASTRMYCR